MTQPKLWERAETLRRTTLDLLGRLVTVASGDDLPVPPVVWEEHRRKLEANQYLALFVGETKRGKSTFFNALLGREVLPTAVDVATCQVFRVAFAPKPAFRLRFENESTREIQAAELMRYGSQVVIDAQGKPQLDQTIRWIEVDAPARFLPPNLAALDTPGLGSCYPDHGIITQRFVPMADAVMFILDSERPLGADELAFIDQLLAVTPHLLFVQTRIDLFRPEEWQQTQKRNEELLRTTFGNRLTDPRVWPVSSTNLRKAAATGDEAYLMVSRHKALAAALQAFLFRAAGWSRLQEALLLADRFQHSSQATLTARHGNLLEEAKAKREEAVQGIQARKQKFESEWGDGAGKRQELLQGVQKAIQLGRQHILQQAQESGSLAQSWFAEIDNIDSIDEANRLSERLATKVPEKLFAEWLAVRRQTLDRCVALLAPFADEATDLSRALPGEGNLQAGNTRRPDLESDWFARARSGKMDAAVASSLTGAAGACLVAVGVIAPPLAVLAAVAAGFFGWWRGNKQTNKAQIKDARQQVRRYLSELLSDGRRRLFEVDAGSGSSGPVGEYFQTLEENIKTQIQTLFVQQRQRLQEEIARWQKQAQQQDDQRRAEAKRLEERIREWDEMRKQLNTLMTDVRALDPDARKPSEENAS